MSRVIIAALAATTTFWANSVLAQQPAGPPVGPDFSKVEIKTTDLGNRTYMLEGFGGDSTIAVGDDGVIMVDGQFAPLHDKLKAAIAAVTPQPVRFLVNTHYHRDHVGGNVPFSKDGAVVGECAQAARRGHDDGCARGQIHARSGRGASRDYA